ncbi:class I SAM-dependent methyltransferase [Sediminicola sp. 1XM1-17]|uniref:class I SAM-dependent methyltransferase n=1 Tax=Sediminicola sp. 1XM1-17 TaxID=3127702 RepID=UPI003077DB35
MDIYLLDQIVKGRYQQHDKILDAGSGTGRNIHWFYYNRYNIWAIDREVEQIEFIKQLYPNLGMQFTVSEMDSTPYLNDEFDHIVCNAVLHFAKDENHFLGMLAEMVRILKVAGSIFIRMASNIGLEKIAVHQESGIYAIPDGTQRFLLTRQLIELILDDFSLTLLEPIKTTNDQDTRCMTTLVLQKN